MIHYYKGFEIVRLDSREHPWGIYTRRYNAKLKSIVPDFVGYGSSIRNCKEQIDYRYYEEE